MANSFSHEDEDTNASWVYFGSVRKKIHRDDIITSLTRKEGQNIRQQYTKLHTTFLIESDLTTVKCAKRKEYAKIKWV